MNAKRHFLLVDEDIAEMRLFVDAFERMNLDCKCTYANTMTHAMKILQFVIPDKLFVCLDKDVSGNLEQVRLMKQDKRLKHVEVIVYCENMHYYRLLAHGLGASICMNKPDDPEIMAEWMNRIFDTSVGDSPVS
jgi:hypothetical protein